MNLTKRRSSLILIATFLMLNNPGGAFCQTAHQTKHRPGDSTIQRPSIAYLKTLFLHFSEQDPSKHNSYSATTFQRFRIKTGLAPKTYGPITDTISANINQANTYLYSTENFYIQKKLKPGFNKSEIISMKHNGKDSCLYKLLSAQMSDLSLINPTINILDKSYLSPFTTSDLEHYGYQLRDSVVSSGDTLQILSFYPKGNEPFDGFCGEAVLSKKTYAIQQINACSMQSDRYEPRIVINQIFEPLKEQWLPVEKKITVTFYAKTNSNRDNFLVAESLIKNYQQEINPPLVAEDFKNMGSVPNITNQSNNLSTQSYSYRPINHNDSLLRLKADSAIIADIRNQQLKMIRLITAGKIQLGCFNLDYNRILGYNLFEGLKIGVGGETNHKLSNYFTFGGYISYGLKDKSIRHGEWINIYPAGQSDLRIYLGYKDMNLEFGSPEFLEDISLLNPDSYRNLLIKNMFSARRYTAGLEINPFKKLQMYIYGDRSENSTRQNTPFLLLHPFNPITLARTGMQIRYSRGLKRQTDEELLNEQTENKPDYYLTIIQGLSIFGGEYRYTKSEFKAKLNLPFSKGGSTTIMVRGGIMTNDGPIIELFNGYGSSTGTFSLAAPYSFATMQLNEFGVSRFTALHLRHNFSTLIFPKTGLKQPELIFAQNIGFGRLTGQYSIQYNLNDYRKGFYESGLEVNNLLRMDYLSWGVGIYYRYGPYQFSSIHENIALKFGFLFKL